MTNQPKHTPGPWKLQDHYSITGYIISNEVDSLGAPISICRLAVNKTETMRANATIIAAAPELLDAVKEALRCAVAIPGWFNADTDPRISQTVDEIRSLLNAAIAKAEGK